MSDPERLRTLPDNPDLAAVLLAGGRSRRMGRDKALLSLDGEPVAKILAERLLTLTDQVYLSTNDPSLSAFLGLTSICDTYRDRGPMAGVHAAMSLSTRTLLIVLACDLPGASVDLLQGLLVFSDGYDAVVPRTSDGQSHPVCAVYRRSCLARMSYYLEIGENRLLTFLADPALRVRWIAPSEGGFSDTDLLDLNSPENIAEYLRLHRL